MLKRLFATRRRRIIATIVSSAVGVLLLGLVLSAMPQPKPDVPAVAAVDQVNQVVASGIAPVDWDPNATAAKAGYQPVRAVSSTELLATIQAGGLQASAINPSTQVTAVLANIEGQPTVVASTLLDSQVAGVTSELQAAAGGLNVTYSPTHSSSTSTYSRAYGTPAETTTVGTPWYVPAVASDASPAAVAALVGSPYLTALTSSGTVTSSTPDNPWLTTVLPLILLAALMYFLTSRVIFARRQERTEEKEKAKTELAEVPDTRFDDVAGADEAIEEMRELVEYLHDPERFTRVGVTAPQGALLVGPPGTGKTLLARAVAGEAGVPFYPVAGSDFVEMYVGVGAKRVRELFDKARAHEQGAIIFIDEIDAVGRARASGQATVSNTEGENTLNALLVAMDGFKKSKVIVLGATNRDDILDPALTRPGRLDRKVQVPLPDRVGREKILSVHGAHRPLGPDVDLALIARRTPGMSGAELAQVVNEAALQTARDRRDLVTARDFDHAVATVTMGKARTSAVISEEDKLLTAWHEAGHAICGLIQPEGVSPVSISIVPRGPAGGVTHFPARDSGYLTRKQAYSQLVTAMGGMAAEQLLLGHHEFTTGPSGDLQAGSNLALAMVTQYGMGERLVVKSNAILGAAGTATDEAVAEADALLRQALRDARTLLAEHRKLVLHLVDALLEWETLDNTQIDELVKGRVLPTVVSAPPPPRQGGVVAEVAFAPVPVEPVRVREREVYVPFLARVAARAYHRLVLRAQRRGRQGRSPKAGAQ